MLPNPLEEIARKLDEYNKRLSRLERLEGPGGWSLIEAIELSAIAANIDFQNIPANFNHLALLLSARGDRVEILDTVNITFNNDGGNNYDDLIVQHNHANTLVTAEFLTATSLRSFIAIPAANAPASTFAQAVIYIVDYLSISMHKTIQVEQTLKIVNASGNIYGRKAVGYWRSTSAINRITFTIDTGGQNFIADSIVSLYGIR